MSTRSRRDEPPPPDFPLLQVQYRLSHLSNLELAGLVLLLIVLLAALTFIAIRTDWPGALATLHRVGFLTIAPPLPEPALPTLPVETAPTPTPWPTSSPAQPAPAPVVTERVVEVHHYHYYYQTGTGWTESPGGRPPLPGQSTGAPAAVSNWTPSAPAQSVAQGAARPAATSTAHWTDILNTMEPDFSLPGLPGDPYAVGVYSGVSAPPLDPEYDTIWWDINLPGLSITSGRRGK